MSGTFEVNGSDTTVRFEYTKPTTMVQAIIGDAAEYLFDHGKGDHGDEENPIVFADLTNQDKLDLVAANVPLVIINMAMTHKSQRDQKIARDLAAQEVYEL